MFKECVILKEIVCPHEEISGIHCSLCKIPDTLELFHFPEPEMFFDFLHDQRKKENNHA